MRKYCSSTVKQASETLRITVIRYLGIVNDTLDVLTVDLLALNVELDLPDDVVHGKNYEVFYKQNN